MADQRFHASKGNGISRQAKVSQEIECRSPAALYLCLVSVFNQCGVVSASYLRMFRQLLR
jgi:hypothetical protein